MELGSTITAVTSHRQQAPSTVVPVHVRFGAFDLDEANARLLRDARPMALAPKPFALLCELARQPGALVTKDALLDAVWGHRFVSESVLKTTVSEVRTTLGDDPREPRYIETVSRRGYRFIGCTMADVARTAVTTSHLDELGRLHRACNRACRGERAIVWIGGDPGVGKTTLIDHFAGMLRDVPIIRGQCIEQFGCGEPYLPILEALADLCRKDGDAPTLLREFAPSALLQLPWVCTAADHDALSRELSRAHPHRMLRELGEFFERYTQQQPLLLVTEDLHWSDRGTIHLMDHVARRRGKARLMWLASFRPAAIVASAHPFAAVRAELSKHDLCEEIGLAPVTHAETARSAPDAGAATEQIRQLRVVSSRASAIGARTN